MAHLSLHNKSLDEMLDPDIAMGVNSNARSIAIFRSHAARSGAMPSRAVTIGTRSDGQMIEASDPIHLSPIRTTNAGQGFQGF